MHLLTVCGCNFLTLIGLIASLRFVEVDLWLEIQVRGIRHRNVAYATRQESMGIGISIGIGIGIGIKR